MNKTLNMKVEELLVFTILVAAVCYMPATVAEQHDTQTNTNLEADLKGAKVPLKTDDEVVQREEQAMSSDGFSVAEKKALEQHAEKFTFQAEVNRLMGIIINSLYSNKDIFLRELISNSSDALDKIRYISLTTPGAMGEGDNTHLEIRIKADSKAKTLTITDRGVGMTKKDLINNLGTIAQSGTKEFLKKVQDTNDETSSMNLIGQFGVGFYSVFLVADKVTVISKHNDDVQQIWESTANDSFTVVEDPRGNTLGRGTQIVLHMKEDQEDYLNVDTLRNIIRRYSEFINYPIFLWSTREVEKEVEEPEEVKEDAEKSDEEKVKVEDEDEEKKEKKEKKTVKETIHEWQLINETKPIWTRPAKEITKEEYVAFYKSITKDSTEPLDYIHFLGEGEVDFKAILYIPSKAPENLFDPKKDLKNTALKLYVRRVFITDSMDELMPKYLLFLKGVVDSDDLPLNVSREVFQQNKSLEVIKKKLVRKAIAMFQSMAEDTSEEGKKKWDNFYREYATTLKWGVIEDRLNRTRISKLLRFATSRSKTELASFEDYVGRMKEGQKEIYWLAGDSREALEKSPLVERIVKRGYEVLYLTDPIDEYTMSSLEKYDGKHKLTHVGREGVKLPDDKEEEKETQEKFKPLTEFLSKHLTGKIEKAVVSTRLTKTPCALVAGSYGYSAHQEKIIKAQALGTDKNLSYMKARRIMEVNHRHPLVVELLNRLTVDAEDQTVKDTAELLYETAALHSGFALEDPASFAERVQRMLQISLNIDANATAEEEEEASNSSSKKHKSKSKSDDSKSDAGEKKDEL